MRDVLLPLLGLVIGAIGTLVGAGGGFILVPILLFVYPNDSRRVLTTISLGVIFANALSGSAAYARQQRIDYRTAGMFAIATVPGSVLGRYVVRFLPRNTFDVLFGLLLIAVAVLVTARPSPRIRDRISRRGEVLRTLRDRFGNTYVWSFRPVRGLVLSFFIGFLSSVMGIGGGIIHVPMMVLLLGFPTHIATATSQAILVVMSFSSALTDMLAGGFGDAWRRTLLIGAGVVVGAQVGAALAPHTRPVLITRALAVSLALVGLRLILRALGIA
jgi:uncharacterized membrane protein YfcA